MQDVVRICDDTLSELAGINNTPPAALPSYLEVSIKCLMSSMHTIPLFL